MHFMTHLHDFCDGGKKQMQLNLHFVCIMQNHAKASWYAFANVENAHTF